jgi:MFS family permease
MMLLRMGVGMGEATLNPCAHSMIADSFPENRRATAMSVFAMGMSVGSGLAFLLGGLVVRFASDRESWVLPVVGAVRPWQLVLLEVGLAGLMVTGLLYAIREPVRRGRNGGAGGVRLSEAAVYFRRNRRTFLHHHLGFALFALAATAGAAWIPEMFRRNFHWSIPKFGFYFGIEVAVCGCLGVVMAGRIADGMLRRGLVDANLRVGAAIAVLALPVNALVFLAPSGEWAIVWLAPGVALVSAPYGVAAAALQQALPGSLRSQGAALYVLSLNLIGAAIGPTLTAALNERLFGREDSLNYSLLIVHVAAFLASATLIWTGRRSFQETVARLRD